MNDFKMIPLAESTDDCWKVCAEIVITVAKASWELSFFAKFVKNVHFRWWNEYFKQRGRRTKGAYVSLLKQPAILHIMPDHHYRLLYLQERQPHRPDKDIRECVEGIRGKLIRNTHPTASQQNRWRPPLKSLYKL